MTNSKAKLWIVLALPIAIWGVGQSLKSYNLDKAALIDVSPTPYPPFSTVVVNLGLIKGSDDTRKIQKLSETIKKYPKHKEIIIMWLVSLGVNSSGEENKLIYKRKEGTLLCDSALPPLHSIQYFGNVTDKIIHSVGKMPPQKSPRQIRSVKEVHWVNALLGSGCKLLSTNP